MAYSEQELRNAWRALYDRFEQLPIPEKRVNEVQCDLTRAEKLLRDYWNKGASVALTERVGDFLFDCDPKPASAPQEKKP